MERNELREQLELLSKAELVNLVLDTHEWGSEAGRSILEAAAMRRNTPGAARLVRDALSRWTGRTHFVGRSDAWEYARELSSIIDMLESEILPSDPEEAFAIAGRFLAEEEAIVGAVDDSDGVLGGEMQRIPVIWLEAASRIPRPPEGWIDRVTAIVDNDPWCVRDRMLEDAARLLSREELLELYGRYRDRAIETRRSDPEGDLSYATLSCTVRMRQVAIALGDPERYEQAITVHSPEPNILQRIDIARVYLRFGHHERVVELLEREEPDRFGSEERERVLDAAYEAMGNREARVVLGRKRFERSPDARSWRSLRELLPEPERTALDGEALEKGRNDTDPIRGAQLLFELDDAAAAERIVLEHRDRIDGRNYGALLELIEWFEAQNRPLPRVVLYRTLLISILDRGYSKAYDHAASYFRQLVLLDRAIGTYPEGLESHERFVETIRDRHGRKRSFWGRVNR